MQTDLIRDQEMESLKLAQSLVLAFLCFTFSVCWPPFLLSCFMVECGFSATPEYLHVLQTQAQRETKSFNLDPKLLKESERHSWSRSNGWSRFSLRSLLILEFFVVYSYMVWFYIIKIFCYGVILKICFFSLDCIACVKECDTFSVIPGLL